MQTESTSENISMTEALEQDTYLKTRQSYIEAELEVSGRYDKWILTLSGGALGLSITFIEKIAKNPTPDTLFWLEISWACLVISLLAALSSLVTSQSAIRENLKELDSANSAGRAPSLSFPRWFTCITNILNWGSLLLFIVGVIFLCVFSFKNIDQNSTKGGNRNGQEASATSSQKAPNGRCTGRLRSTTATDTSSKEKGIRSAAPTTKKGKGIDNKFVVNIEK